MSNESKLNKMKGCGVIIVVTCIIFPVFVDSEQQGKEQQFPGACPQVTVQKNLAKGEYAGRWYEIKRFENKLMTGECGETNYVQTEHGYKVSYSSKDIKKDATSTIDILIEKEIVLSPSAKYDLYSNCSKDFSHYILETDYKKYNIVWGCAKDKNENMNIQRLFIYSREKSLDEESMTKILEVLQKNNIDHTQLKDVQQDDEKCNRNFDQP